MLCNIFIILPFFPIQIQANKSNHAKHWKGFVTHCMSLGTGNLRQNHVTSFEWPNTQISDPQNDLRFMASTQEIQKNFEYESCSYFYSEQFVLAIFFLFCFNFKI